MQEKAGTSAFLSPVGKQLDVNVEMVIDENKGLKACSTCNKLFKLQFAYTLHLCLCKSTVMECSICNFKFTDGENLQAHILKHHEGKLLHSAKLFCLLQFEKGKVYHKDNHFKKDLTCNYCNEVFDNAEQLQEHKKSPEHKACSKKKKCTPCQKEFIGKYELNRHYQSTCPFNPD